MLEPYLLPPTEHIVYYDQTTYTTYPKLLSDIIHNCPILQEVLTGIAGDFDVMLGLYGPWILEKAITRTIVCLYPALEMAIAEPLSKQATMFTAYFENELQVILAYIEPKIKGFSEDQLVIVKEIPSKITALVDILSGYSDKRLCGIVFVKERVVAQLLTDLLNAHPTLGFIKAASVMGHSRGSRTKSLANLLSMTLAQQQNVFAKFALGEINLLVATSVAEEGIDINPCNVVIRFDWGDTLINYVQSRGRSRTKDSDYYILAQNGDNSIEARLDGFKSAEKQISAKLSMIMDVETIGLESFVIKESGIEVTIENAKWMLGEYCSMLPVTDERACCQYDHYTSGGVFQAKITLPQIVPQDYRVHIGTACPSLHAAVARASFDMLLILDKYGELDGLGTPQDQAHDLFSDLPAGPGKNANIMRECIPEIPPIFTGKYVNRDIYLYKISLISKESKIMMNIGMLTSGQCPTDLNTFKIPIHNEFFTVRFELHPDKLRLSQEKINLAGKFHTALFQVISRVELDESLAWSPLCVPLKSKDFCRASAYTAIDWKQILDLQNEPPLMSSFDLTDPRCLEDIAVVDQYRFRHVYFPVEIDKSRTPMSKYYNPSSGDLGEGFENIAAMYKIRFACGLDIDADQPIINAMPIDLLYSCWIPKRQRFTSPLIPQLLKVHPINRKYIIDTLYLPCILTHYLHLLNMRDLKASLGIDGITPQILHNACTSVSANSDCDYETLETFGDSFLKLHLSIHAFVRQPLSHEGELSKLRTQFESNLAFSKAARESLKLENRIQTMPISRKTFVPPHYPSTQVVQLSDKSIADVLEAIVGACVVHCNFEVGCKAIRAFLGDEMEPSWEQYMKMWDLQPRLPQPTQEFKGSVRILQKRIGFKFDQATYLCFCIMHSTSHRDMNVFQRLEFLGDAVLGFAATRYLYAMDDRMTPFQISYARSLLVNNHFLSWISFELTLPMHMRHSDISISQATLAGGKQHKTAHADLKNFVADGNSLPWKTEDTPPKMFADQVEALIGAMFLDSRFDFKRVELFIFKEIFDPWWKFILPVFTAETAWIESHKRKRAGFGDN